MKTWFVRLDCGAIKVEATDAKQAIDKAYVHFFKNGQSDPGDVLLVEFVWSPRQ